MKNVFQTKRLKRWEDIGDYAGRGWLFRGQSTAKWGLKTSLERCCERHKIAPKHRPALEHLMFREFRRTYHHYAERIPHEKSIIEWLSLMQHHGAPTRLLDFTYSIYVAMYFAAEGTDGDCAIWAVDGPWAMARAEVLLRDGEKTKEAINLMFEYFDEDVKQLLANCSFKSLSSLPRGQRTRFDLMSVFVFSKASL